MQRACSPLDAGHQPGCAAVLRSRHSDHRRAERAVFELAGARCAPDLTWLRAGADLDLRGRGATLLIISDSPLLRRVLHMLDLDGDLPLRGSARAAQEEVDRNGHR
jgi:hypothetical protein